jgi:hypothetical protein
MDPIEPDPGDAFDLTIPVEAIRAYSVGRLPFDRALLSPVRVEEPEDDGTRVRVAQVLVDGEWVPL